MTLLRMELTALLLSSLRAPTPDLIWGRGEAIQLVAELDCFGGFAASQ